MLLAPLVNNVGASVRKTSSEIVKMLLGNRALLQDLTGLDVHGAETA
jgi:hypothetical protein